MKWLGAAVIFVLASIIVGIALPNVLNARQRGRQKRTMSDLRTVGTAAESYSIDNARYPVVLSIEALAPFVEPTYVKVLPRRDGWGREFRFESTAEEYTVASSGSDGRWMPAERSPGNGESKARKWWRIPLWW